MKIFSNISTQFVNNIKNQNLKAGVTKLAQTKDVFEHGSAVKTIAKEFRETVIKPFGDFNAKNIIPADAEKGSGLLKGLLEPFTKIAENFNKSDAERFVKLSIGEKQLEALTHGAKVNSDVKQFVEVLEANLGQTISQVVKG